MRKNFEASSKLCYSKGEIQTGQVRNSSVRGQNIIRIIALIGLCALVYYFSFEQGRLAMRPRIKFLEDSLAAKDRVLETLALEVSRLKERLTRLEKERGQTSEGPASRTTAEEIGLIKLQRNSSRVLFNRRLVLTCLDIDQRQRQATLQINLIHEDRLRTEAVKLGQGLKFTLDGQSYKIIVDRLHTGSIAARIIKINRD